MKAKTKFTLLIIVNHVVLIILSYFVFKENKMFFILSEVVIFTSLMAFLNLLQSLFRPLEYLQNGIESINTREFNVMFVTSGQPEVDSLIKVYNAMIEQLRMERKLQEEKHYLLEKLIIASPVGILMLKQDGSIQSANPKATEIINIDVETINKESLMAIDNYFLSKLMELEEDDTTSFNTPDGKKFKIQKVRFFDQGINRCFIIIEDLTHEVLLSQKSVYEKVIKMMAHEVNNSVGAVNSILNMLGQKEEDHEVAQAIHIAVDRNMNLEKFMQNFSEVVRLPRPNKIKFNLNDLIKRIIILMEHKASSKNIKISTLLAKDHLNVLADPTQMEQVAINILKNSIESIEDNGHIYIHTKNNPIRLYIEDNGKGISKEIEVNIFSPFFSSKENGQGIGLTLTREIIANHGFEFYLKTIAPGRTVFFIQFDEI